KRLGLRNTNGSPLPDTDEPAALVAPDGVGGRAWLTTSNFKVIMQWNRSTYFAASVGLLAEAIAGGSLTAQRPEVVSTCIYLLLDGSAGLRATIAGACPWPRLGRSL